MNLGRKNSSANNSKKGHDDKDGRALISKDIEPGDRREGT
jgi:hypothetical protein